MSNFLTIKIPYDLARFAVWQRERRTTYDTNRVIKALDTWLVLKAETNSSYLQNWNKQKQHLFAICKVTESIFRARIKLLQDLQLLSYNRNSIRLCSWDQLSQILEVDTDNCKIVQYNIDDKQRVQEWIIATEISDNQQRQAYKVMQKLNKNPVNKQRLSHAVIHAGADVKRISDPAYFLSWLNILYRQDFVLESEIHDLLIEYRPDTNRGVLKMAETWKARHPQTVSYWKKMLQSCGIITIGKLQIVSNDRVRNAACCVRWIKSAKQTMLCLPDSITVLTPWLYPKDNTDNTNFSLTRLSA